MCDIEPKLVAWLDCELPLDEAAGVKRHIEACEECRDRFTAYQQVSETFDVYCYVVMAAKTRHRVPRWVPALASAVAVAVVMYLSFPRTHIEPPPAFTPTITTATAVAIPTPLLGEPPPHKMHRRRAVVPVETRATKWLPTEAAVQIAIPAEAVFPPGVMPEGLNFVAELSIASDGSVRQVRLRQ